MYESMEKLTAPEELPTANLLLLEPNRISEGRFDSTPLK
jgi:hypothetical protein